MPKWLTTCPVCESKKAVYRFFPASDTGELEESFTNCPCCGYSFAWSVGWTAANVNGQVFQWDWSGDARCKQKHQAYLDALALANAAWFEQHPLTSM